MGAYYSQDLDNTEYNVSTNNSDKKPNESHIYRSPNALGIDLFAENKKLKTMHDFYRHALENNGNSPFLGTRYSSEGVLQDHYKF